MPSSLLASHVLFEKDAINAPLNVSVKKWSKLRFDLIDMLYISPFTVLPNGVFGLSGTADGPNKNHITDCFEALVTLARGQNANIKIIAMQFWGGAPADGTDFTALSSDQLRTTYAQSVAAFLGKYATRTGKTADGRTVSLRVDGYDVDYEWVDGGDGNQQPWASKVLALVRQQVDAVSVKQQIPRFTVSVTPASAQNLNNDTGVLNPSTGTNLKLDTILDYLTMQNYSGGYGHPLSEYTNALPNLAQSKIFWGITLEGTTTESGDNTNLGVGSVDDVQKQVTSHNLAGAMVWRMNSDNWVFQNMVLIALFNKLKGGTSPANLVSNLATSWKFAGRNKIWPTDNTLPSPVPVSPCTEADWDKVNEYRS